MDVSLVTLLAYWQTLPPKAGRGGGGAAANNVKGWVRHREYILSGLRP